MARQPQSCVPAHFTNGFFGSISDFHPRLGPHDSLIPVKQFPTNLTASEVDLRGPVHRNLQKFQENSTVSLSTSIYSAGGKKESLEQHSV